MMNRKPWAVCWVLLLVATLGAACSGGGGGGDGGGPTGGGSPSGIGPSGGTVTSSDGKTSVNIPAGALSQDTVITVAPASNVPSGNIGTAYEFGPDGTSFGQPVTISISYDETALPSGVNEASLRLGKVVNNVWQPIANAVVDTGANLVSGATSSFSVYGVIVVGGDGSAPAAPSGVTTVPGDGSVTISWDAAPGATAYNLYMAAQSGVIKSSFNTLPGGMLHSNVTSPFVHTGLTNGTVYYFVLTAVNANGESTESSEVSAMPASSVAIPNAPGNLRSAAVSSTQINLAWADSSTNEDGFKIERKTAPGGVYIQLATVGPNITSYSDTNGLAANTIYCYQVRASNGGGNSGYSNESCVSSLSSGVCTTCDETLAAVWGARYNGPANLNDTPSAIFVDSQGNVYVTGSSAGTNGKSDFGTVKYDSSGNPLWVVRYKRSDNLDATPTGILVDPEGNVYVAGSGGTAKYDSNGNELWTKPSSGIVLGFTVDEIGGVYIVGQDYEVIKYDINGKEVWRSRNTPGGENAVATAMTSDNHGNIYVTGYTYDNTLPIEQLFYTVKYNQDGALLSYASNPSLGSTDRPTSIAVDRDLNVYVTGWSSWPYSTDIGDYVTIKYKPTGGEAWTKRYDDFVKGDDVPHYLTLDSNGNVYVTGESESAASFLCMDYATVKYDTNGNQLWNARYDDPNNCYDSASYILIDTPGNVYVSGNNGTVKYDSNGHPLDSDKLARILNNGKVFRDAVGNLYTITSDGDFITTKYVPSPVTFTLNISRKGNGSGIITSAPSGIHCGASCSETFASGATITLKATPGSDSTFLNWDGDPDCLDGQITMDSNKECVAVFHQVYEGVFTKTGSMTYGRSGHTATLLNSGKVLVAGGATVTTAELYDPSTETFTATGNMTVIRTEHTATLLSNGKVLIAGGYNSTGFPRAPLSNAEIYDPDTGIFTQTSPMISVRADHTATLLSNGKVLIAGGCCSADHNLTDAEFFDPEANQGSGGFVILNRMSFDRAGHTATLLTDGNVLIVGGGFRFPCGVWSDGRPELFTPSLDGLKGVFSLTVKMNTERGCHTATLLLDGRVLLTGGTYSDGSLITSSAELFDSTSGTFGYVSAMHESRANHTATPLSNGVVLITGGRKLISSSTYTYLYSAEIYDPATANFKSIAKMTSSRSFHTATILKDGRVLIVGGAYGQPVPLSSAEIFQ